MKIINGVVFCYLISVLNKVSGCTTFAVGRKATVDGSVMATHSNDGGGTTDPRLVKIPSRDFKAGDLRPIHLSPENYPRYVGDERLVDAYFSENCQAGDSHCESFEPIGYIPQVNHTSSYFEATYGTINEKQVSIAESTCSGVYVSRSVGEGGGALLSVDQLSQIAMERANTAREAVEIMGSLAEQYGFYGESASFEGGSESLLVIDPTEAWVFHILADPTGKSAIWVAARVPDDSVAVVANMFSIRVVDLTDTSNFLGRQDMWELAAEQGLYVEGQPKDFTKTFSDGEYAHKYYSGRRMWGVFRLLSPTANLPATYDNLKDDAPYPFAVKVDKQLTAQDVMAVMRDWYGGSEYSTEQGLAGGAFGSPDRYSGSTGESQVSGSWERTISIYRSSDSYVVQARPNLPHAVGGIVWFGSGAAHSTAFVPILAGMSSSPDCLLFGWQGVYNQTTSYWAHRNVLTLAQVKFSAMIVDIRELQTALETESQRLVDDISLKYGASKEVSAADLQHITTLFTRNAEHARSAFTELFHTLLFKYGNNYLNAWSSTGFHSASTGYPAWWLEQVGYADGPGPVSDFMSPIRVAQEAAYAKKQLLEVVGVSRALKETTSGGGGVHIKRDFTNKTASVSKGEKCHLKSLRGCVEGCTNHKLEVYKACAESCLKAC